MKEEHEQDELLGQWTMYRRDTPGHATEFTGGVMDRIAANESEKSAPKQTAPRLQRLALTSACAAAGIAKILIVLRLSI